MTKRRTPQKRWKTEDLTVLRTAIENAHADADLWGTPRYDGNETPGLLSWPLLSGGFSTAILYMDVYEAEYSSRLSKNLRAMSASEYDIRNAAHNRNSMIKDADSPVVAQRIFDLEDRVETLEAKVREMEDFDV